MDCDISQILQKVCALSLPDEYKDQWPFQDPRLEVPTTYKAYFSGLCKGISPQNMAKHMVLTYLQSIGSWNGHWKDLKWQLEFFRCTLQSKIPMDDDAINDWYTRPGKLT